MIDSELLAQARDGGPGLERLIAAVWPEAYRVALGVLRDRGLAEDAAQDACATIAARLPSLRDPRAFTAWCYKIAANRALSIARRQRAYAPLDDVRERASLRDPSDALELYDALASLSPLARALLLLHYYGGLRSGEIAEATALAPATVRFHLMRARRSLRKALAAGQAQTTNLSEKVVTDVH